MVKFTLIDLHTFDTLDRAYSRAMRDAELKFYKDAAHAAATDAQKMLDALKSGETVTIGSSVFGGLKIMRVPESAAPTPEVSGAKS